MFRAAARPRNHVTAAVELCELVYHCTVRSARGSGSNAVFVLLMNIAQTVVMILALYFSMTLLGFSSNALRGDFLVFLISGVMSYVTYKKTMGAVFGAEGPTSPMMLHAPMNTMVSIAAAALAALYIQILTVVVVLFTYHAAFKPVDIHDPVAAFTMLLCAWLFGIGTGMVLLAAKPWAPKLAPMLMTIISRVNIFASGKMLVGNTLSFALLPLFSWNPLFHIIDQMRGDIFVNYVPRNSSVSYALWVTLALIVLGLMGEFFTRKQVSASWFKR